MNAKLSPILVTGAPRSGTTFVGKMLSLHHAVAYVDEPFNAQTGVEGIDRQFMYVGKKSGQLQREYMDIVRLLLAGHSSFKISEIPPNRLALPKRLARRVLVSPKHLRYKLNSRDPFVKRYLVKDPMACFASEYLHRVLGMKTVVVIRHPASTIASYMRLGWRFRLSDLTSQDELMKRHLQPILGHVNVQKLSPVQEWAYLWLSINTVLGEYLRNNPKMLLVRHEDLSRAPLKHFEELYASLDLNFTPRIRHRIIAHTKEGNPVEAPKNAVHVLKRNSAELVHGWKRILGPSEVEEIRRITAPIAQKYYASSEW